MLALISNWHFITFFCLVFGVDQPYNSLKSQTKYKALLNTSFGIIKQIVYSIQPFKNE